VQPSAGLSYRAKDGGRRDPGCPPLSWAGSRNPGDRPDSGCVEACGRRGRTRWCRIIPFRARNSPAPIRSGRCRPRRGGREADGVKGRRERRRRRVGEREIEPYQAWATERERGGGRRKATGLHFTPAERLQLLSPARISRSSWFQPSRTR